MGDRAVWVLIVTVASGWFVSEIVLPAAVKGYVPPAGVNEGLGIIAGVLIAGFAAKRGGKS